MRKQHEELSGLLCYTLPPRAYLEGQGGSNPLLTCYLLSPPDLRKTLNPNSLLVQVAEFLMEASAEFKGGVSAAALPACLHRILDFRV